MNTRLKMLFVTLLLAAAVLSAGCSSGPKRHPEPGDLDYEPTITPSQVDDPWALWDKHGPQRIRTTIGGYFKNRALDFLDMFDVSVTGGPWARIQADYLIGFWGLGSTDCQRWRIGQRSVVQNEETTTVCIIPFPASLILFPAMLTDNPDAKVKGTIVTYGGVSYEREEHIWPDPVFQGIPDTQDRMRMAFFERDRRTHRFNVTADSLVVGAEVHLLVGARARVMPVQILDFIAGILGWDMVKDDVKPRYPE